MKVCEHCGEDVEYIEGVGWVEVATDGHYDICVENYTDEDHYDNAGHKPWGA